MTTKLADADKLSRSLRAVLREKEDAVVALESGLALKQQEVHPLMNTLMFYYVSPSIITFFMPWYYPCIPMYANPEILICIRHITLLTSP